MSGNYAAVYGGVIWSEDRRHNHVLKLVIRLKGNGFNSVMSGEI